MTVADDLTRYRRISTLGSGGMARVDLAEDTLLGRPVALKRMNEAAQRVRTGMVTFAVRDTDLEDWHIKQGDIIGLYNGKIQMTGHDIHDVTIRLMREIMTDDDELITVYYGKDVPEAEARGLTDEISGTYTQCDVEMLHGGQPLYYYLISVE